MGLKEFTSLQIVIKSIAQLVLPDTYVPGANTNQDQTVFINEYAVNDTLDEDSTPAPTELLVQEITIDGTLSEDIDLTAADIIGAVDGSGDPTKTEDLTGAKLFYIEAHAGTGNAGDITIAPGSSNGYDLFGSSIADGIKLPPGGHFSMYCVGSDLDDVGATDKIITISGAEDDTLNIILGFEA